MLANLLTLLLLAIFLFQGACVQGASNQGKEPLKLNFLIRDIGGRVDWGPNNRIVYDEPGADGWADIGHMKADGSDKRQLTHNNPKIPQLHCGNPAWHPSGKYIVFQALDPAIKGPMASTFVYKVYTSPGAGVHNNLWLATADGKGAWQLTNLGRGEGVLHPHFSRDGKLLVWSEMFSTKPTGRGSWKLKFADFSIEKGKPKLANIRSLRPGKLQFYEVHSFFPKDTELLFTGMPFGGGAKDFTIYRYHLETKELTALTDPKDEHTDEHAQVSPDGKSIIWMSSAGTGIRPWQLNLFMAWTEYWMMNTDGTNRQRLTWFSKRKSAHWQKGKGKHKRYHRARVIASDGSWSPDGTKFVGYVQIDSSIKHPGSIVVFEP